MYSERIISPITWCKRGWGRGLAHREPCLPRLNTDRRHHLLIKVLLHMLRCAWVLKPLINRLQEQTTALVWTCTYPVFSCSIISQTQLKPAFTLWPENCKSFSATRGHSGSGFPPHKNSKNPLSLTGVSQRVTWWRDQVRRWFTRQKWGEKSESSGKLHRKVSSLYILSKMFY